MIAFKFTTWDIPPLENFKNCAIYQMKLKLLNGGELDKDEQECLMEMIRRQGYKTYYRLQGWQYDFKDFLNEYWIDTEYCGIKKVFTFNKTQARKQTIYCGKMRNIKRSKSRIFTYSKLC